MSRGDTDMLHHSLPILTTTNICLVCLYLCIQHILDHHDGTVAVGIACLCVCVCVCVCVCACACVCVCVCVCVCAHVPVHCYFLFAQHVCMCLYITFAQYTTKLLLILHVCLEF